MLSNKLSVSFLTLLLKAHGIKHIVLCPGSRNIPLVHNFSEDKFFTCYSLADERSAAFFAMGLSLKLNQPCAVCCTSGSAVLNMHSAIAEAYYQKLPLLILSADRSKAYIEQMDGQTLYQNNIFTKCVKYECELNEVKALDHHEDVWFCQRTINEALLRLKAKPYGPVHINIPIADPFFSFELKEQDLKIKSINYASFAQIKDILAHRRKRLLIIGQNHQHILVDEKVKQALNERFDIYLEHLSNVQNLSSSTLDSYLIHNSIAKRYDVVVSIAGHIVSKRLKQALRAAAQSDDIMHLQIDDNITLADTYHSLRYKCLCSDSVAELLTKLSSIEQHKDLKPLEQEADFRNYDFAYSAMSIIKAIFATCAEHSCIHLANSSAVRYAEFAPLKDNIYITCNRGVNGIDGSISTAIGYAALSDSDNYIITGDLSFLYDINGLWHQHKNAKLKIVLLNNGGGEIFSAIKGLSLSHQAQDYVVATHSFEAQGIAKTYGLEYFTCHDDNSLQQVLPLFNHSTKASILECKLSQQQDIAILKQYFNQLKTKE